MTLHYGKGNLTLAVMGDLLRNPGTSLLAVRDRLEVKDTHTIRITLGRLEKRGWVRRVGPGFMLGRAGIEHLATVRRWVSV